MLLQRDYAARALRIKEASKLFHLTLD